jgi:hypothetical protein
MGSHGICNTAEKFNWRSNLFLYCNLINSSINFCIQNSLWCSFICFRFCQTVIRVVWVMVNVGDFDSVRESKIHGCKFI